MIKISNELKEAKLRSMKLLFWIISFPITLLVGGVGLGMIMEGDLWFGTLLIFIACLYLNWRISKLYVIDE